MGNQKCFYIAYVSIAVRFCELVKLILEGLAVTITCTCIDMVGFRFQKLFLGTFDSNFKFSFALLKLRSILIIRPELEYFTGLSNLIR